MILYSIKIKYKHTYGREKIIDFPEGKIFKNFNEYFEKDEDIHHINGYNKNSEHIYAQFYYGDFYKYIYNEKGMHILTLNSKKLYYPIGRKAYYRYINYLKEQKLKKILNSKDK